MCAAARQARRLFHPQCRHHLLENRGFCRLSDTIGIALPLKSNRSAIPAVLYAPKEAQRYSAPPARLSAFFILFLSYAFLFGAVRVTGQRPFQLPRCLLWNFLCAFLLCFSIGTHRFMVSSPFLSYLLEAFVGLRLYVLTEFQIVSVAADEHLIRQFF